MPHTKETTEAVLRLNNYITKLQNCFHQDAFLFEALENLNDYTESLYTTDELGGQAAFTRDKQEKLLGLYSIAYSEIEKLLGQERRKAVLPMLNGLRDLLAIDMNTLLTIEPDTQRSLQEIMISSRAMKISIEGKNMDKVGAFSSTRYAMTIERNGREVQGFFTREKKHTSVNLDRFRTDLENAAKENPQLQEMLNDQNFRDILNDSVLFLEQYKTSFAEALPAFKDAFSQMMRANKYPLDEREDQLEKVANLIQILQEAYPETIADVTSQLTEELQYDNMLAAEKGSSITGRNVAMSRISQMLGISHTIAQSDFMKIQDEQGNITDGIFMEKANGIDYSGVLPEQLASFNPDLPPSPSAMKNIAELQILDFICQNVDRHQSNFLYQLSKDGTQLVGIQGIDNDYSFGTATDTNVNDVSEYQVKPIAIHIIPADLNQRLELMDDSMMELALKDTGLGEKEIAAAVKRMNLVKEAVKNNRIRVVDDEQFKHEDMKELSKDYKSLFRTVSTALKTIKVEARQNQEKIEENGPKKPLTYEKVQMMNGLDLATMKVYRSQANAYANRIALSQARISDAGSQQFRDLENAVGKFASIAGTGKIGNIKNALQSMQEAADKYIAFKNPYTLNMRTRERIKLAKEIRTFAKTRLQAIDEAQRMNTIDQAISENHRERENALKEASEKLYYAFKDYCQRKGENDKLLQTEHNKEELLKIFAASKAAVKAAANPDLKPAELSSLALDALKEQAAKTKTAKESPAKESPAKESPVLHNA